MILTRNLTKKFGELVAVDNLTLDIQDGEIFGFIGPNGAGKTTTLKMLAGVLQPTNGSIVINGLNIAKEPEMVKKQIGFIPDDPYIYEKLSGFEFLEFVGDLFFVPREEQKEKILNTAELFRFHDMLKRRVEEYSRGNRQKLSILAALIHDPKILLIDEPVVGLDPAAIKTVKEELKRQSREKKTTIFLSTHTLNFAEAVCDRLGIITEGKLVAAGTLAELKQKTHQERATLEEVFLKISEEKHVSSPSSLET